MEKDRSNIIPFRKRSEGPFETTDERILGRIMQLGHAFTQAVAEEEETLAEEIIKEAQELKDSAR